MLEGVDGGRAGGQGGRTGSCRMQEVAGKGSSTPIKYITNQMAYIDLQLSSLCVQLKFNFVLSIFQNADMFVCANVCPQLLLFKT